MASNKTLLMLPGDGIGPEVCAEVRKVVDWMDKRRAVSFDVAEDMVGGAAYDAHGTPLTDAAMEKAQNADAVLFGAVGGPQYDTLGWDARPEAGLLRLRKEMDLFANLRPAVTFDALLDASTLKPEVVRGLDIMIVRELTSGVYSANRGAFRPTKVSSGASTPSPTRATKSFASPRSPSIWPASATVAWRRPRRRMS